jgi:hypothetical protein
MWLFTLNSFVSVVRHREEPDKLLVRARRREDLVELLGQKWSKSIFEDGCADYRFRVIMPETDFQEIVSKYIHEKLTYDNFKAAQKPNNKFLNFLHKIWGLGLGLREK